MLATDQYAFDCSIVQHLINLITPDIQYFYHMIRCQDIGIFLQHYVFHLAYLTLLVTVLALPSQPISCALAFDRVYGVLRLADPGYARISPAGTLAELVRSWHTICSIRINAVM